MLKALEQINRWKPDSIQEYCKAITTDSISRLTEHGYWVEHENWRGSHLFGIRIPPKSDMALIRQKLIDKKIFVSIRGNAIRVSPNVYNRKEEMERFARVLIS
jgi:selenocysteine lyase/cysteine desulfurase